MSSDVYFNRKHFGTAEVKINGMKNTFYILYVTGEISIVFGSCLPVPFTMHGLCQLPTTFTVLLFSLLLRNMSVRHIGLTAKAQGESETEGQDKARPGSAHWLWL